MKKKMKKGQNTYLVGIDNIHDDAALQHFRQTSLEDKVGRQRGALDIAVDGELVIGHSCLLLYPGEVAGVQNEARNQSGGERERDWKGKGLGNPRNLYIAREERGNRLILLSIYYDCLYYYYFFPSPSSPPSKSDGGKVFFFFQSEVGCRADRGGPRSLWLVLFFFFRHHYQHPHRVWVRVHT